MRRNNKLAKDIMASMSPVMVRRIETRMLVAKMLQDYISARGMSQLALAVKMGKRPSEVSKWLSGNHNFTIDTLSDIGYHLHTDFIFPKGEFQYRCNDSIQIARPYKRTAGFGTQRVNCRIYSHSYKPSKIMEQCLA